MAPDLFTFGALRIASPGAPHQRRMIMLLLTTVEPADSRY